MDELKEPMSRVSDAGPVHTMLLADNKELSRMGSGISTKEPSRILLMAGAAGPGQAGFRVNSEGPTVAKHSTNTAGPT